MKWLDKAFAPLKDYLASQYPGKVKQIMGYMSFKENENGQFLYENRITSGQIVFDQAGALIYCGESALQHEFAPLHANQTPVVTDYFHPNIDQWIHRAVGEKKAEIFRKELRLFLQHVWGPISNFDFGDLKVDYPLKGPGSPYCLYVYPSKFPKLIAFQFVGDEIVERHCSLREYQTFEKSERAFMYEGWQLQTLIREHLEFEQELSVTRACLQKYIEFAGWRTDGDMQFVLSARARNLRNGEENKESS